MSVWKFHYELTIQEYLDFNEFFLLKTPMGKKSMRPYRSMMLIVSAVFWVLYLIIDHSLIALVIRTLFLGLASVIWWVLIHKILLFSLKRRIKKKNSSERAMFSPNGEISFDFEERVIIDEGAVEQVKVSFDSIDAYCEGEKAFYFFYNRFTKGFIVPYSLLKEPEAFHAFREQSRNTFPSGAVKK